MMATIDVDPDCLADIVPMLNQFGIKVIGSDWGEGVVCLAIEGDIVPACSRIMIEVTKVIGSTHATLTATCRDVTEAPHGAAQHR
jgi:hypothetical protein